MLLERCDNDSSEIKADSVEVLTKQDKGDRRCRLTLGFSKPETPKVPKPQPPVSDMAVKTLKERGESSLQTLDVNRKGISTNKDVGSLLNISLYESITLDDTALDTLNLAPVTIASPAAEKPASPAKKVAKSAKPKTLKVAKSHPPVSDMVVNAVNTLKERGGSTLQDNKKAKKISTVLPKQKRDGNGGGPYVCQAAKCRKQFMKKWDRDTHFQRNHAKKNKVIEE